MRRRALAAFLLTGTRVAGALLLAAAFAPEPAWADELIPPRVAQRARERVEAGQYPILVIGVVDGDQSELAVFGRGPDGAPAARDSVFEIGSVTKTFTATLLAEAIVHDGLRLDQPVADLLPGWTIPARGGRRITLSDLATHRSGLPPMPDDFAPAAGADPYADYGEDRLKRFMAGHGLKRPPGADYEYSNLGYALLGAALAEQAGASYRDLLRQRLFAPLGMDDSDVATGNALPARLAPGRTELGEPAVNWDFDAFAPAGGIRSTGDDMMRYLRASMAAPPGSPMALAQQPIAAMDEANQVGLAWRVTGRRGIVWHSGMTGGYAAFIGFTADRRQGVVILTNAAATVEDLGFAALAPDAPLLPAFVAVTLPPEALDEVTGVFRLADGSEMAVFRHGEALYVQRPGQAPIRLTPSGRDSFFARIAPIALTFARDAAGQVDCAILHQNGDMAAARITPR